MLLLNQNRGLKISGQVNVSFIKCVGCPDHDMTTFVALSKVAKPTLFLCGKTEISDVRALLPGGKFYGRAASKTRRPERPSFLVEPTSQDFEALNANELDLKHYSDHPLNCDLLYSFTGWLTYPDGNRPFKHTTRYSSQFLAKFRRELLSRIFEIQATARSSKEFNCRIKRLGPELNKGTGVYY